MTSTITTTIRRLLLGSGLLQLLGLSSGCGDAPGAADPGAFPPAVESAVDAEFPLSWTLSSREGRLLVSWEIKNQSGAPVWLLDTDFVPETEGYRRDRDHIVTVPGAEAGLVRLVRGHLRPPPGQGVAVEYTPAARELAPGASQRGEARPALPLTSWHPYYVLGALPRGLKRAVLEIGILVGDPPDGVEPWDLRYRSVPEGAPLKTPTLGYVVQRQRFIKGEVLALPE